MKAAMRDPMMTDHLPHQTIFCCQNEFYLLQETTLPILKEHYPYVLLYFGLMLTVHNMVIITLRS